MNFLVWNVRGLNDLIKQKIVVSKIRELKIYLVCLLETRVKEQNMGVIHRKHFQGWQVLHNYLNIARNGRIWLLWKGSLQVDLADIMEQYITYRVIHGT